jgi:hypothetical protein
VTALEQVVGGHTRQRPHPRQRRPARIGPGLHAADPRLRGPGWAGPAVTLTTGAAQFRRSTSMAMPMPPATHIDSIP